MTETDTAVRNPRTGGAYARRITFRDAEADSPFCVLQGPILFDGEAVNARISKDHPLTIRTRDGLGTSEVITSFVVLRDDFTMAGDSDQEMWAIGGVEVCVPPQSTHPLPNFKAEDYGYDWVLVHTDAAGEWWRVHLLIKPEFVYG